MKEICIEMSKFHVIFKGEMEMMNVGLKLGL